MFLFCCLLLLLLEAVQMRRPAVCVSGHIHEAYGATSDGATLYINAATSAANGGLNHPIVFDIRRRSG